MNAHCEVRMAKSLYLRVETRDGSRECSATIATARWPQGEKVAFQMFEKSRAWAHDGHDFIAFDHTLYTLPEAARKKLCAFLDIQVKDAP